MDSALSLVCVLALCLFFPPAVCSQSPPASGPDITKYATEPYVIEELHKAYRIEADGKGQRESVVRVRVQSESAVREFGLMVYPYMASFETLEILYARVRKPDGAVVETPAEDMQELDSAVSRQAPMYTDQRERHVAVKSLAVGDTLEVSARWTIHDAIAPGHFWFDDEFFDKGICLNEVIEFNVPAGVPVKVRGSDSAPQLKEDGGRRIYMFRSSHLKKAEDDKGKDELIPSWEKDFYGVEPPPVRLTSFSSWADVGTWYAGLQQPRVQVTPRIRSTAEEITKGKTTEDEKIRAIYDYVSTRFRYIGIDLGLSRYTPHAAEDVLSNRYGDCKDKHTLLAALLESSGVHAYPALVSSKYKIDPEFPSAGLFDHVITAVPRGDSYLFLDTTPEVAPFGLLMAGFRDRKVLVIPTDGPAKLVTTPPNPPFPGRENFRMDATIDEKGTLDGKTRFEERGDPEILLRLAYRNTPQNQWKDLTQRIVANLGFGGSVSEVVAAAPEKTSEPFLITFDYHRAEYSDWKENRITLPFPPLFLVELNEAQKTSTDPLPIGSPQEVVYEATLKVPAGMNVFAPENVDLKTDFAEYHASYHFEGETLSGSRQLITKIRYIPGSERVAFSAFAKSVQDDLQKWILVVNKPPEISPVAKATQFLRKNQPDDAIKLLEAASKEEPENSHVALLLGTAYLRLSEPDEEKATAQFQKVLADQPDPYSLNAMAYSYADAKVRLKEAVEYASRAVAEISAETMDASPDSSDPSDFLRMSSLAADWDTLGWAKFRSGDVAGAEKYLQAAWALLQRAVIGEHLAEVYEKLGQKSKAANTANLALAAPGLSGEPELRQRLQDLARVSGSQPHGPSPAPSGTISVSRLHSDPRIIRVPRTVNITGTQKMAAFAVTLENGIAKAQVRFISGDKELLPELKPLSDVDFHQPFPDSTPTRILLAGYLSCSSTLPTCTLIFLPVDDKPSLAVLKTQPD